jgi:NADH-quinone oxidoreductase subunit I
MWNYCIAIIKGFWTLLVGMKVTVPHLGRHAITIQYPKKKMEMFEPFRGRLALSRDPETNQEKCTGCQLCAKACPSACITVTQRKDEEGRRRSEVFEIDMSLCCYCGLCVETCPEDAIVWVRDYEYSVYDKKLLLVDKHALEAIWRHSLTCNKKEKADEKAA